MSMAIILEEIKGTPSSIIPILQSLHSNKSLIKSISKSDLSHLISRTLNLAKSPKEYNRWCGINLIRVICEDYTILANHGSNFLSQLILILENYNATINIKILINTVETINYLCGRIRGKPTLTREILTPKLATIIGLYLEKLYLAPKLIIGSLQGFIKYNSTTFRPFGNKLNARLVEIINRDDFGSFPRDLQYCIYETLAMLPAIEKQEPESKWNQDVVGIIGEIGGVVGVYQEFLNFKDDQDLIRLVDKVNTAKVGNKILEDISIDFNEPKTILQLSDKIEILLNLLRTYLTTETQFTVKVPIGLVLTMCEVLCCLNVKFLSFKGDIRDDQVKSILKQTLAINHKNTVLLLNDIIDTYKGNLIPHLSSIISFLEVLIPFKNRKVSYDDLLEHEQLYSALLDCVGRYLSLVEYIGDNSQLLRFIDVALLLVEPRIEPPSQQQSQNQQASNNKKQNKKRKNTSAVPLSDILSHEHLFNQSIPSGTVKSVRKFIDTIITRVALPSTQHYKIMRYLIIEAVIAKHYNQQHLVPSELKTLLINAVLYPGYEKISVLPIVSSILGNDPVLSVFNNPRFPPLPKYIKQVEEDVQMDEEDEEEEEEQVEGVKEESEIKRRKINEDEVVKIQIQQKTEQKVVVEDKSKLFTKENISEPVVEVVTTTTTTEVVEDEIEVDQPEVATIPSTKTSQEAPTALPQEDEEEEESGSDFEMPQLNADESDDE